MMENRYFSIGAVIKKGWEKFKEHPFTWIGAFLLILLISITHSYVLKLALGNEFSWNPSAEAVDWKEASTSTNVIVFGISLAYYLILLGLSLGIFYMGLRASDGLSLNLLHLFSRFHYVFHYLVACILYNLIIGVGFILLLFPAAIWGAKFALYPYFIVDKGAGPIRALKLSSEATHGFKWDIFAFMLISVLLLLIGIALLFIGLLVVLPIINIAWATIYRKLSAIDTEPAAQPVPIKSTGSSS
ncbi:MAG: hypothetical protein ACHQUC_04220 [Chlamydiales bacterium]